MNKKGIFVSCEYSNLTYKYDFLLIRVGFTDFDSKKTIIKDKDFEKLYEYCICNNIFKGIYYESCATSLRELKKELDFILDNIKDKKIEYPIVIKMMDNHNTKIYNPDSQEFISKFKFKRIIKYTYNYIKNNGYIPLIITYKNWINNTKNNVFYTENIENNSIFIDIHNKKGKK